MKSFHIAIAVLLAVFQAAVCVAAEWNPPLPSCGLSCITKLTLKSTCSLTNITCICTSAQLNTDITACVAANCTIREQLATQKYSKDSCGVEPQDRTKLVSVIGITFGVLAVVAFGLRILSKFICFGGQFGMDDYTLIVVMGLTIPLAAMSLILADHGLGKDIWNVPYDNITYILWIYFWDELIYIGALSLTKISIMLLYLRIFRRKSFRYWVYGLMAANIACLIVFELISIFQCRPLDAAWKGWDGEYAAQCNNIHMQGWMNAALNIFFDLATLILPLYELYKLEMSGTKKLQIMLMFSVGIFVTIVSILRLKSLTTYANTTNITQDYVEIGYWSTIEVPVGIICACMPSIRTLLRKVFPGIFASTQQGLGSSSSIPPAKISARLSSGPQLQLKTISEPIARPRHPSESSSAELVEQENMWKKPEAWKAPPAWNESEAWKDGWKGGGKAWDEESGSVV